MLKHSTTLRVRYSETDQMRYVYYGQYASYLEVGRVETMREYGIEYAGLECDHGVLMPVVNLNIRYLRPVLYDTLMRIDTEVRKVPSRYMIFHTNIYNADGKLAVGGRVTLCFLEADTRKRLAAPDFIIDILAPHFA